MSHQALLRLARIAIAAAVAVIGLKLGAWFLTGSVGLLSDAVESLANLAGAVVAYLMLSLAQRPPDEEHRFGHSKAEYFSTGFEGSLILVASGGIAWVALPRLLDPQPLSSVGLGLGVAFVATAINFAMARVLLRSGRESGSITLEASGHHLMTDVWTSLGILAGVGAVEFTGLDRLDPIIALLVAVYILYTGLRLLRRAASGLLDSALPEGDLARIRAVLEEYESKGIRFHAFRTRTAGQRSFISMHVLVPGDWTVKRGHDLAESVEERIREQIKGSTVFTHIEPIEDPASFRDREIPPARPPRRRP